MQKFIVVFFLLAVSAATSFSQRATGLIFNKEAYKKIASFPDPNQGTKSIASVPLSADLSSYVPPICNQGSVPSCVAWSTAYNAYTIQYAYKNKINAAAELREIALSAMLPYKQIEPNCDNGSAIETIAEQIISRGNVSYPDFNGSDCVLPPSYDLLKKAEKNKPIKDFVRIFDEYSTANEKIYRTKQQIATYNTPVILAMQVHQNFDGYKGVEDYYVPEGDVAGYHAVVVVGYNMKGFKIVNSWGPGWGKSGFFWVEYADFAKVADGAIVLRLPDDYKPGPVPPTNKLKIGGDFAFRYVAHGEFAQTNPTHVGNGIYELSKKDWGLGQQFQLLTNNKVSNQYMYVFSVDAKNKLTAHWPKNNETATFNVKNYGLTESPILPVANFDVIIPSKESALTIDEVGTDYLGVIYSDKKINNITEVYSTIQSSQGDIYSRLKKALGSRLIPSSEIKYSALGMKGTAETTQGDTIPLVLKIQSVN
jgi:hypothetical protein